MVYIKDLPKSIEVRMGMISAVCVQMINLDSQYAELCDQLKWLDNLFLKYRELRC